MRKTLLFVLIVVSLSFYSILAESGDTVDIIKKGDKFFEEGKYRDALNTYDQAIQQDSSNAIAYEKKAETLTKLNRFKEALIAVNKSLEIDATSTSAQSLKDTISQKFEQKSKIIANSTQVIPSTITTSPQTQTGTKNSYSKSDIKNNILYSKSGYLNESQMATYEFIIGVNAQVDLIGPSTADFDVYAVQSPKGSWPSDSYIMEHNEKSDLSNNQTKHLKLTKGNWYCLIDAKSGNGKFQIDVYPSES